MIEKFFEGAYPMNELEKVQIPVKEQKPFCKLNGSTCHILCYKYNYSHELDFIKWLYFLLRQD